MGIEVRIWTMPQEVQEPIPFEQDDKHAAYDPEYAQRLWRILVQVDRVMTEIGTEKPWRAHQSHKLNLGQPILCCTAWRSDRF
jgi:hypothetical protein